MRRYRIESAMTSSGTPIQRRMKGVSNTPAKVMTMPAMTIMHMEVWIESERPVSSRAPK